MEFCQQLSDYRLRSIWWICSKNLTHKYMMPPALGLLFQKRHRESCPFCKGLRRKERSFARFLDSARLVKATKPKEERAELNGRDKIHNRKKTISYFDSQGGHCRNKPEPVKEQQEAEKEMKTQPSEYTDH